MRKKNNFGYIEYLSEIMINPNTSHKNNGEVFECSENSKNSLSKLCFYLSNGIESKKRSMPRYVGHGAFGTVYIIPVGRESVAIKHVEIYSESARINFEKEIKYQIAISELPNKEGVRIAPKVYDYFYCKCNDKVYGTFIMEYLGDYNRDYQIYHNINNQNLPQSYLDQILPPLKQKINNIIDIVVSKYNLNIADFQIMIKNDLSDVKVIDLGLAKNIPFGEDKEEIKQAMRDRIFLLDL